MAAPLTTAGQIKYALPNDYHGLRIALSGGAFDTLIPSASTFVASSSGTKHFPYDVFINHCGQDVKHTLASKIYYSLDATGLRVFLDKPELKFGDLLPKALEEAMSTASIYIAIFSQHYAQSPWCLAELEYMVKTSKTIIPIFYHVQPSVLRWTDGGKGVYADAFSEHEKKDRYAPEVIQQWKQALQQVSCCLGGIINDINDEHRVVKTVVNRVMKEMNKVPLKVAKHPVGLDTAEQEFDMIALQSAGPVKILGIWGMGGSGKTTLAKEIFNNKRSTIDKSSFLFDLREAARKDLLHERQIKLLKDLDLKSKRTTFDNVHEGKEVLTSRLRSVPVLIVLDDVDHTDQLDALLPVWKSLGHGSLIIVTTREMHVLKSWSISAIYKMKALNATHAEQLFCWHAFLQPCPLLGFEDLVKRFVKACNGLPLSLKVLGGQLYGESIKNSWEAQLDKLSRILPNDIKLRLKISYDALDKEEKEMFLDIACFFIGWRSNWAIAVWDGSQWNGLHGLQSLVEKCLVEVGEKNRIIMHDHLRDLGREIANRHSPYRLWFQGQIIEIQPQQEVIRIRGIANATGDYCYYSEGKIFITTSQGARILNAGSLGLKFFVGTGHFINNENYKVLKELVWFRCYSYKRSNIPSWLSMQNLRVLQLYIGGRLEELWDAEANAPLQLRELAIKNCRDFRGFPESIARLTHLREIRVIAKSSEMKRLPEEFCLLQSLEVLILSRCTNLLSLPSNFGKLMSLQRLDLTYCPQLHNLPDSFKQLTFLKHINLEGCLELTFELKHLDILEHMIKLEYLNLNGCRKVELLPLPKTDSLIQLCLKGTRLRELPANIGHLSKLPVLQISSKLLETLPNSLGHMSSVTALEISSCPNLESLPTSLWNLPSLTELEIVSCEKLQSLPDSLGHPNLSGLGCRIKKIQITSTDVSKISISDESCPCLVALTLGHNQRLEEVEDLPRAMETLKIEHCYALKSVKCISPLEKADGLPIFAKLLSLKEFELIHCPKVKNIEGLEGLKSLEKLKIIGCEELEALPSLAELTSLKILNLQKCGKLEKMEGAERLTTMEKLRIVACPGLNFGRIIFPKRK